MISLPRLLDPACFTNVETIKTRHSDNKATYDLRPGIDAAILLVLLDTTRTSTPRDASFLILGWRICVISAPCHPPSPSSVPDPEEGHDGEEREVSLASATYSCRDAATDSS